MPTIPIWLDLAREIYSISQSGLTYCKNDYDLERYRRLQQISAEIIAAQSDLSRESVQHSFAMQTGYATPKVDVRAAIFRDDRILLVREASDGGWTMPGGWCDLGDAPAAMAIRESLEESGFHVRVDKLIGVYDANHFEPLDFYHAYKLVFLCSITGGEPTPSYETPAVDFFSPTDLPLLSENRTNPRILAEVLAHLADPLRPTYFE